MPNTLTKTYVPSFDEFIEDPDKWLQELEGNNINSEDVNAQTQQSAQPVIGSTEEAAPAQATASGDVGLGGSDGGASTGWDSASGAQPIGGQMSDDQGGFGETNIQAPDAGAQGTQPGVQPVAGQPGSQPAAGAQGGFAPEPGAQPAPGTQPAAQGGFNTPPPTQPAQPNAQEEDPNKPKPAGF
jgi:hypothetical protein